MKSKGTTKSAKKRVVKKSVAKKIAKSPAAKKTKSKTSLKSINSGSSFPSVKIKNSEKGILVLGAYENSVRSFTVFASRNGKAFSQIYEITRKVEYVQGLDYGPKESVVVIYQGHTFTCRPFLGLATISAYGKKGDEDLPIFGL